MSTESTRQSQEDLQFDRAVHADAPNAQSGLTCGICSAALSTQYYHVADRPACERCKEAAEAENRKADAARRHPGVLGRSLAFGFAAAIAGAILYYAVIAITGWEIGLVAIVIGFMVGAAVRKGSANAGGRRFQWIAVVLTYFAVGLAYSPIAFKSILEGNSPAATAGDTSATGRDSAASTDSAASAVATARAATASGTAADSSTTASGMALALGATFLFIFALPVLYVAGSMPSGLISALIIVFGMQQAWKMTAKAEVPISGPYQVGSESAAPA